MNIPHDTTAWARFLAISPYTARLGIEAIAAEDGGCVLALPYRPDFVGDPDNGVLHGGAVTALIDTVPPVVPLVEGLLPVEKTGDPAIGEAVRGLAGKRSAVMLANHGPVVAAKDVEAACNAIEELEATARLALMLRGLPAAMIPAAEIPALTRVHRIAWDT